MTTHLKFVSTLFFLVTLYDSFQYFFSSSFILTLHCIYKLTLSSCNCFMTSSFQWPPYTLSCPYDPTLKMLHFATLYDSSHLKCYTLWFVSIFFSSSYILTLHCIYKLTLTSSFQWPTYTLSCSYDPTLKMLHFMIHFNILFLSSSFILSSCNCFMTSSFRWPPYALSCPYDPTLKMLHFMIRFNIFFLFLYTYSSLYI